MIDYIMFYVNRYSRIVFVYLSLVTIIVLFYMTMMGVLNYGAYRTRVYGTITNTDIATIVYSAPLFIITLNMVFGAISIVLLWKVLEHGDELFSWIPVYVVLVFGMIQLSIVFYAFMWTTYRIIGISLIEPVILLILGNINIVVFGFYAVSLVVIYVVIVLRDFRKRRKKR